MVDLFYSGAAHSSSYPPTHCIVTSFPSSGDHHIVIVGRNWQLLPTTPASRSPRFVRYDGSSFKNHTSLRLLQQMEHENGIEPSTSSMARTRSDQLSYSRKKWSVWWEPNPRNQLGRLTLYRWVTDAWKWLLLLDSDQFSLSQSQVYYQLY